MSNKYLFVIDTDKYAGNFERPMCAYMTGQVGDCGVGDEEAKLFAAEEEDQYHFEDLLLHEPDDHGCHRPATIWPTPGWWNDGDGEHFHDGEGPETDRKWPAYLSVGIWMEKRPSAEDVELLKKRAHAFLTIDHGIWKDERQFKIIGFRLVTVTETESGEAI